jgi:hypothetical protein
VPTEIGHYRGDPLDKELPNAGFTLGTPAAIVFGETGGQTLLLVVQGIDNLIYENFFFPSYPGGHPPPLFFWRGWTDVPGGGQTPSGPEVVITGEASWERPWVFVQGFDNRVYHNTPSPDLGEMLEGIWTGWTEVPGNGQTLSGPGAEGTPTSGHVLAIRGMDNQIYVARVDTGTD